MPNEPTTVYIKRLEHSYHIAFGYMAKDSGIIRIFSVLHEDEFNDIFGQEVKGALTQHWQKFTITVGANDA